MFTAFIARGTSAVIINVVLSVLHLCAYFDVFCPRHGAIHLTVSHEV